MQPTATMPPHTTQSHPALTRTCSVMTFAPFMGDVTLGQGSFGTCWYMLPSASMVDSVTGLRYAECSRAPDYVANVGFLGRWGTHACPQRLPGDIVPVRSWTRMLRPPGIRHRHLPCHAMHAFCSMSTHMSSNNSFALHEGGPRKGIRVALMWAASS